MRQRLGLAAALLGNPSVLLLDEPANGLDPEGIRWLRGFLRHLASEGRTILVSSHVLSEVQQTVDDVVANRPDVLVIIDSPGFTHAVASRVRKRAPEIPIVDYVSPSVWAWRPWRAASMRGFVDHVLAQVKLVEEPVSKEALFADEDDAEAEGKSETKGETSESASTGTDEGLPAVAKAD